MRPIAHDDWHKLLDNLDHIVDQLRRDGPDLLRRARSGGTTQRDGCPRSYRPGGGGPSTVLDEKGRPMPPINDPVGELVAGELEANDPVRVEVLRMVSSARAALTELEKANVARVRALPPADREDDQADEVGCIVCHRYGFQWPVYKAARCRACYEYRRRSPDLSDPPEDLVVARHRRRGEHAPPNPRAA